MKRRLSCDKKRDVRCVVGTGGGWDARRGPCACPAHRDHSWDADRHKVPTHPPPHPLSLHRPPLSERCGGSGWGWRYVVAPLVGARNGLTMACMFFAIIVILSSCIGDQQASQQPDPRLQAFHILSSRIIMLDNQAEVDGTVQNTGHDPFPYDVTIDATFYDKAGNVIGQAAGVAEDVLPGMIRPFVLLGQADSVHYSHMQLAPVSLRERRIEKNTPTPPPISP